MSGTEGVDPWATNVPYIALVALVTVLNNWGAVAGALVGLKNAGAALLIVGVIVTIGLELAGYEREPLREALFGR
jgi:hypothetical protein